MHFWNIYAPPVPSLFHTLHIFWTKVKELMMFSNPLDPYLRATGISFVSPHTANWRGYEGTWEIKGSEETGERLHLVALHAHRNYEDIVGLEEIFPGFPDGVFAHWFSGEIYQTNAPPQGIIAKIKLPP